MQHRGWVVLRDKMCYFDAFQSWDFFFLTETELSGTSLSHGCVMLIKTLTLRAICSYQACSNTTCSSQRIPITAELFSPHSFFISFSRCLGNAYCVCFRVVLFPPLCANIQWPAAGEFCIIPSIPAANRHVVVTSSIGGKCIFYEDPSVAEHDTVLLYRCLFAERKTFCSVWTSANCSCRDLVDI